MSKQGVAYHEAGHAIIALVHGLPVVSVTIEPDNDEHVGECQLGGYTENADNLRADMLSTLAGGAAHAKLDGRQFIGGDYFYERGDAALFDRQLHRWAQLTGLSKERAIPILHQETEQLVDEHWGLIVQLADTLLQRGWVRDVRLAE